MILINKSVKIYDNTMQLYSWLKINFTAVFVVNIFHEKVYISQFLFFAAWFICLLYVIVFSNLAEDGAFIKFIAHLNKL